MFGIRFRKRDLIDLNLCFISCAMIMLSIFIRMEAVWKPAIIGASSIVAALAIMEAGTPKRRRLLN